MDLTNKINSDSTHKILILAEVLKRYILGRTNTPFPRYFNMHTLLPVFALGCFLLVHTTTPQIGICYPLGDTEVQTRERLVRYSKGRYHMTCPRYTGSMIREGEFVEHQIYRGNSHWECLVCFNQIRLNQHKTCWGHVRLY